LRFEICMASMISLRPCKSQAFKHYYISFHEIIRSGQFHAWLLSVLGIWFGTFSIKFIWSPDEFVLASLSWFFYQDQNRLLHKHGKEIYRYAQNILFST
jgi:hypothetical protein